VRIFEQNNSNLVCNKRLDIRNFVGVFYTFYKNRLVSLAQLKQSYADQMAGLCDMREDTIMNAASLVSKARRIVIARGDKLPNSRPMSGPSYRTL